MARTFTIAALAVIALTTSAAPLVGAPARTARTATPPPPTPAEIIRTRIAGYREMGTAFKNAMDGLRGDPQIIVIQQSARTIKATAQAQYRWFPAGSGSAPRVKTLAKPEIWTKTAEFRAAQDQLTRAADAFQAAAASGNADTVRGAARGLGGACKNCHDQFRVPPS